MELKRAIFYIFDTTRILFNDYYNGHGDRFSADELKDIKSKIEELEKQLNELKEVYHDETIKG